MGVFGLFGKEPYSVECARCHESLTINREEVEAGGYKCPVCNGANAIPDSVRAEYKKNRAQDEVRRQEQERKQQEREHKRKERIRREMHATDVQKQKKPEEQRPERKKRKEKIIEYGCATAFLLAVLLLALCQLTVKRTTTNWRAEVYEVGSYVLAIAGVVGILLLSLRHRKRLEIQAAERDNGRDELPGESKLSLMRCPACNKEVSIKAVSCPHCGHPFPVSLKHCRDCGHEVSIKAGRCPQCGARMPATSQPGMTVLSLVVFVLVVLWCRYFVWPLIEHLFGL